MASQQRRNRPCDACRRRKSKCVTEEGSAVCVLCKFHGQSCEYKEAPQPRKRGAAASASTDASFQHSKRARTPHTSPGTGVEEYDALPGQSLLKRTLGLQNLHHSEYIGIHAYPDVHGPNFGNYPGVYTFINIDGLAPGEYVRFVSSSAAFRIVPDDETEGHEAERALTDEIEATTNGYGPQLIDLYFRIIHPSFPVLHRDVFLEKYARSHREFVPPLLAAVYLLASCYWTYSEALAHASRIEIARLQKLAFSSLHQAMNRPKLSTVQAGLLLSQFQKAFTSHAPNDRRDRLTVQLVNVAHGLGLHLDCTDFDIPEWEIGLRRRIAWALYMQDKWTALLEGRPSLISAEDWDVAPLTETDFPETSEHEQEGSSEVDRGRVVFVHMAHLTVILSDILRIMFSATARRALEFAPDPPAHLLNLVKPLQLRLRDWSTSLPPVLRMETPAAIKLSSVGYLRLAYLSIEVCVHRTLLRTLVISHSAPSSLTSTPADLERFRICRSAAQERFVNATAFLHALSPRHLASFWYFSSAQCCALIHSLGVMLEATSADSAEKEKCSEWLRELRWTLKVDSEAGAGWMKRALGMIAMNARVVGVGESIRGSQAGEEQGSGIQSSLNAVNGGLDMRGSGGEEWSEGYSTTGTGFDIDYDDIEEVYRQDEMLASFLGNFSGRG